MRPVDVEGGVVTYLAGKLSVPVSTRVPAPRPESFVRVWLIGGTRANLAMATNLLQVECWAGSETAAQSLAADTWEALDAADGDFLAPGVWLADGQGGLASPVNNSDPETGSPRYTFTANLTVTLEVSA